MLGFIEFLIEKEDNNLLQEVLKRLKILGYEANIAAKKANTIIVRIDRASASSRIAELKKIETAFKVSYKNTVYKEKFSGSSVGATKVNNITVFVKPSKRDTTHYEAEEIVSLNKQFEKIKEETGFDYIPFKVKNKIYNVVKCVNTPGTPKSDFHLIDTDGKECIWISHKAGSGAKDFQQWGGVSSKEAEIYNHKETQEFIQNMHDMFPDGIMPNKTTIMKKIKSKILRLKSVYGKEYIPNGKLGRQNVTFVLQGNVKVVKDGEYYTLKATNTHINGDDITGDFEPVFMSIYKGDRSNLGIKGMRVGIQPIASRKYNIEI